MSFKQVKTADPDLTRVQQNVATAFDGLPSAKADKFVTTRGPQYRITGEETHVFVDASANPVTVVLPPTGAAPIIKRIDSGAQPAAIQAADRALIDGDGLFTLGKLAAAHLVFDGKSWWSV